MVEPPQVYLAAVDRWGNACSFINSNYMGFGTGIVPEGCGFTLQNRNLIGLGGHNFILKEGHPNCVGPSKYCYHTIIPGMVLCAMADYGLDPQAALDQPRFCLQGVDSAIGAESAETAQLLLEEGLPQETQDGLRALGHDVAVVTGWQRLVFGRGQPSSAMESSSKAPLLPLLQNQGQQYLIFGNGNGITSSSCYASWDLHEIELWDENGDQILNLGATSLTGEDSGYEAWKAVDGTHSAFWAGDHDVGMSCSCWNSEKLDGQAIRINLPSWKRVSKIRTLVCIWLTQGGAGNEWAISEIRIHCGSSYQSNPLLSQISFGSTDIECNASGCQTTRMDPAYYHTCNVVSRATSSQLILASRPLSFFCSVIATSGEPCRDKAASLQVSCKHSR
eukprot:s1989_g3.t2